MTVFRCEIKKIDGKLYVRIPDFRDLDSPETPQEGMILLATLTTCDGGNTFALKYTEHERQEDLDNAVDPDDKFSY